MNTILLVPPIAFIIYFVLSLCISKFTALVSAKGGEDMPGKLKAYACGEDIADNREQPDYSQFFPFAFFFTIMHVVALIVTTVPSGIPAMAILYILVAAVSILILFRR